MMLAMLFNMTLWHDDGSDDRNVDDDVGDVDDVDDDVGNTTSR